MLDSANSMAVACGACHVLRVNLLNPDLCQLAIVEMNHKSSSMRGSSSKKDRLFECCKQICHKVGAGHFGIIWKCVDDIEPGQIQYDRKHEFLL
jgi:hypothetical protein